MATKTTQRLWVSDNGDVTCDQHSGHYMTCAIEAKPKSKMHRTPIGTFIAYTIEEIGLPCSGCVDWSTLELN